MEIIKKDKYYSFREYCKSNPNRDKKFDRLMKYSLSTQGFIEVLQTKLTERDKKVKKEVEAFFNEVEKAHQQAAKSNNNIRFKSLESTV